MPAVSRMSDLTAGHDGFPPRKADQDLTSTVFCNGEPIIVLGSHFPVHVAGRNRHESTQSEASTTVFAEGNDSNLITAIEHFAK